MDLREKREARGRRHKRVRRKVRGTKERPRLSIYRSLKHIYAQLIDDDEGRTLFFISSLSPELKGRMKGNVESAKRVGKLLAEKGKEKGILALVFDRGGYRYHGRVKALADGAREGGLKF